MKDKQINITEIDEMSDLKKKLEVCTIKEVEESLSKLTELQARILLKLYVYSNRK